MPSRRTHPPLEIGHAAHLADTRPAAQAEASEATPVFNAEGSR